jgi:hypothetical protein
MTIVDSQIFGHYGEYRGNPGVEKKIKTPYSILVGNKMLQSNTTNFW